MTVVPKPRDGEYLLSDSAQLALVIRDGVAYFDFAGSGGYDTVDHRQNAAEAAKALLHWCAWRWEQDVAAWLAAEKKYREGLRHLGSNKGRLGRGA